MRVPIIAFLLLIFIVPVSHSQTTVTDSFLCDGVYRSYIFRTPANIAAVTKPLVINMHGLGSNAGEQQFYSFFDPIADTAGFFLVMPQGTKSAGTAFWNVGFPGSPAVNDVKFISALIDTLGKRYPIDLSRVYATGLSNGGYMSHVLALELSNKIAAIASVAGSIVPQKYAGARPVRAMPVMQIHGDADATVPYNGFAQYGIPIDTLMAAWVRWNGCNPTPAITSIPNTNTTDGSTAEKRVWSGGRDGSEAVLFRIYGGGHTWPGSPFNIGVTNRDISASLEIWRFFRKYNLQTNAGIDQNTGAGKRSWFMPNPAKNLITVAESAGAGLTTISDISGRAVMTSSSKKIDVSSLPAGTYMMRFSGGAKTLTAAFVKE